MALFICLLEGYNFFFLSDGPTFSVAITAHYPYKIILH